MADVKYPEVTVQLTERSGNVFAVIGTVQVALDRQISTDVGDAFAREAMSQSSYDDVLRLAVNTVNVE